MHNILYNHGFNNAYLSKPVHNLCQNRLLIYEHTLFDRWYN